MSSLSLYPSPSGLCCLGDKCKNPNLELRQCHICPECNRIVHSHSGCCAYIDEDDNFICLECYDRTNNDHSASIASSGGIDDDEDDDDSMGMEDDDDASFYSAQNKKLPQHQQILQQQPNLQQQVPLPPLQQLQQLPTNSIALNQLQNLNPNINLNAQTQGLLQTMSVAAPAVNLNVKAIYNAPNLSNTATASVAHASATGAAIANTSLNSTDAPVVKEKRRRKRWSNREKKKILDNMERITSTGGTKITMKQYCQETGISEGTLAGWIKNKEAIYQSALSKGRRTASCKVTNYCDPYRKITSILQTFLNNNKNFKLTSEALAAKAAIARDSLLQQHSKEPFLDEKELRAFQSFKASLSWAKKWTRIHRMNQADEMENDQTSDDDFENKNGENSASNKNKILDQRLRTRHSVESPKLQSVNALKSKSKALKRTYKELVDELLVQLQQRDHVIEKLQRENTALKLELHATKLQTPNKNSEIV